VSTVLRCTINRDIINQLKSSMSGVNLISLHIKIMKTLFVLHITECLGLDLPETLESFHPCIVVQLHFNPQLSYSPSSIPAIITNGTRHLTRSHWRRSHFCIAYFIFFPEIQLQTNTLASKFWIYNTLYPIGIVFEETLTDRYDSRSRLLLHLMEPHYIIIISKKPYANWIDSMIQSAEAASCYSSIYYFKVSTPTIHGRSYRILKAFYFCKHCHMFRYIIFRIPTKPDDKNALSKSSLDRHESYFYKNGKRLYVQFGTKKFYESTNSIYKPHLMRFKRKPKEIYPFSPKSELNIVMITEILLF